LLGLFYDPTIFLLCPAILFNQDCLNLDYSIRNEIKMNYKYEKYIYNGLNR